MKLRKQNKNKRDFIRLINKDRDWDYVFIYKLLHKKLSNVIDYFESDESVASNNSWKLSWLKRSVSLLNILISERVDINTHININNAKRFREAKVLNFHNEINKNNETFYEHLNIKPIDFDRLNAETFYLIKAKHLLFNILTNYIQCWWD